MESGSERPTPRHRSDQRPVHVAPVPGLPDRHPEPGRYLRPSATPGRHDHGIGFRSSQEVVAEMSPVIYRPSGGPDPDRDRDADRPPRVSIAGPGVPTAASYNGENPVPPPPPAPPDDLLDEDPEIAEDELVDEAEDELLDDLEDDGSDVAEVPLAPEPPVAPPAPPAEPRRRRGLLSRFDHHTTEAPPAEPAPVEEPPVAPPEVTPDLDDEADAGDAEDQAQPAPHPTRARRRRVRTLHISPPPTGPAEPDEDLAADPTEPEPVAEAGPIEQEPETDLLAETPPEPVEADLIEAEPEPEPHDPRWRQPAPRLGTTVRTPVEEPTDAVVEPEPETDDADDARHRRTAPAISGHVTSTRGRGLSGTTVTVLGADDEVVASTVTGRRGGFVVEDLPPGAYRLSASDPVDGDFADAWFGGSGAGDAEALPVDDELSASGIDIELPARVVIVADVAIRRTKVVVELTVTDRTSGLPAKGRVVLSTDLFSAEMPLSEGRAAITLFGTPGESSDPAVRALGKRLRVDYRGTRHTAPQARTIVLR